MFRFDNLDIVTRTAILEAIDEAESNNNIYYSTRFTENGKAQWLALLKQAAQDHNEHWLAYQLEAHSAMKDFEGVQTPSGGYTTKHVPHTAAITMAEGQFNRFYILGLCKRAKAEGISHLEVYRAQERSTSRSTSQSLIGTQLSIAEIEAQLKEIQASFKSDLVKPNSGISMKLVS
jgi:hypothetical protein